MVQSMARTARARKPGGTGEHGVGLHKMNFLVTETGKGAVVSDRQASRPSVRTRSG